MEMADRILELGLDQLGYTYVNVDDCSSVKERPSDGIILEDPLRFPRGMKWLSDVIHSRGLKFGLYTAIGEKTCEGYPALGGGHAEQDILKFAEWEIDSLKVDGCFGQGLPLNELYTSVGKMLNATGRPILYGCSWPAIVEDHCENPEDMESLKRTCNLFRAFDDIEDEDDRFQRIVNFYARNSSEDIVVNAAGPGHWNDPDMLVAGDPGLSLNEQRAQFAIWSILAAPLFISSDLRTISKESLDIVTNKEVIAINQDGLGKQGYVISEDEKRRIWMRPLSGSDSGDNRVAVLFQNKLNFFNTVRFQFDLGSLHFHSGLYSVRDVHRHRDVATNRPCKETFIVDVDESSIELYIFTNHVDLSESVSIEVG